MKTLDMLIENAPQIPVEKLAQDSRAVSENTMFFCIKGQRTDGHIYAAQAAENGASVIVHSDDVEKLPNVVYLRVEDTMKALNEITDKFYDYPSKQLQMIGVTGTNGKSTTSYVAYQILNKLNIKAGYIGTIDVSYAGRSYHSNYTTPETVELHGILADMVKNSCKACAMEVSSSGLEFHRVDTVKFDVAVYTNLTHEHLDVHGTMDNYFSAKAKLFEMLADDSYAVLNMDDEYYQAFRDVCHSKVVTYSTYKDSADFLATNIKMNSDSTTFTLIHDGNSYEVSTNLLAMFNISNLLGAISAVYCLGYSIEEILENVNDFQQVKGRVELVEEGQPFKVIVDYAHTPDSFEKILPFARSITPKGNSVITVFGSAGHRDTKKRPVMGEIADKYSDLIILTEDDYRTEDPKEIANEIKAGIKEHRCVFISQRQTAITQAVSMAQPNDTILLLGKGEDSYMAVGDERRPYPGDQTIVRLAIKKLLSEQSEYD
ncbi:MAG: UDP-N-acetylmuramoyl-L-alanyl-D-glutamate--2,6-diaminopimelate ligase [Erysipelotrichales bacterium]|nr:UDP-N-acetylmuramoyl-L-alanyl-D-glutamate--2,6-diaminopimelate ligase [Erysipelotrichales bacterium]